MPKLDAASVRSEIAEAPDAHGLSPEQATAIEALSDDEIDSWIHELAARDDAFWSAYDALRRSIIERLVEITGVPPRIECDECDEPATQHWPELKTPVHLCDSCAHDARRSGWEPGA